MYDVDNIGDLDYVLMGTSIEQTVRDLSFREAEKRGIEKGKQEAHKQIEFEIKKFVTDYINTLLGIACAATVTAEKNKVKIIDYKTCICPEHDDLTLFLVLESLEQEDEINFGLKIAKLEREILIEKNIYCEIFFVCKSQYLDIAAIKRDYPVSLKVPNANTM